MRVTFKTFQSGVGDCIFLLLKQGETQFSIMVDCGRYTPEISQYVKQTLCKRIDLLIVTHIDADHNEGITKMLLNIPDLAIGEIWFNCYQRSIEGATSINEIQKTCLTRLYGRIPQVIDIMDTQINSEHAMMLREVILANPAWKAVWRRDYIKKGMPNYLIADGAFGTIKILSPTQQELNDLDNEFKVLFYEFFYGKHPEEPLDKDTTIYELLQRVAQESEDKETASPEQAASINIDKKLIEDACKNKLLPLTPANRSSIAFVWEYSGHKILFLGDSSPAIVVNSIDGAPVYDAVKTSHHGSAHSTSVELMGRIDSPHYFFTGGKGNARPHIDAIARVINRPLKDGIDGRVLHFNYSNDWVKGLNNDILQEELHFSIDSTVNELSYDI